jgi:hypothetical protein
VNTANTVISSSNHSNSNCNNLNGDEESSLTKEALSQQLKQMEDTREGLKVEIKAWITTFEREHKRKPTKADTADSKIGAMYDQYNMLGNQIKALKEKLQSSNLNKDKDKDRSFAMSGPRASTDVANAIKMSLNPESQASKENNSNIMNNINNNTSIMDQSVIAGESFIANVKENTGSSSVLGNSSASKGSKSKSVSPLKTVGSAKFSILHNNGGGPLHHRPYLNSNLAAGAVSGSGNFASVGASNNNNNGAKDSSFIINQSLINNSMISVNGSFDAHSHSILRENQGPLVRVAFGGGQAKSASSVNNNTAAAAPPNNSSSNNNNNNINESSNNIIQSTSTDASSTREDRAFSAVNTSITGSLGNANPSNANNTSMSAVDYSRFMKENAALKQQLSELRKMIVAKIEETDAIKCLKDELKRVSQDKEQLKERLMSIKRNAKANSEISSSNNNNNNLSARSSRDQSLANGDEANTAMSSRTVKAESLEEKIASKRIMEIEENYKSQLQEITKIKDTMITSLNKEIARLNNEMTAMTTTLASTKRIQHEVRITILFPYQD